MPPSLVTPKSHDLEYLPPAPALGKTKKVASKKAPDVKSSNAKRQIKPKVPRRKVVAIKKHPQQILISRNHKWKRSPRWSQ